MTNDLSELIRQANNATKSAGAVSTKYDVNIWNEGWHNDEASRWKLSIHEQMIASDGSLQCGDWREDLSLTLTDEEAERMTLGKSVEEGGDYTPDEDFFLDVASVPVIYKDVPERVKAFFASLPEYTMTDWSNR